MSFSRIRRQADPGSSSVPPRSPGLSRTFHRVRAACASVPRGEKHRCPAARLSHRTARTLTLHRSLPRSGGTESRTTLRPLTLPPAHKRCRYGARQRGHPVGFAPRHANALQALHTDRGARDIIAAHRESLELIETRDSGVIRDIDTPASLAGSQVADNIE